MKRRTFLTVSAGAAVAAPFVFTKKNSVWASASSPLAVSFHPGASTWGGTAAGTGVHPFSVDQAVINSLVDSSVLHLTGAATVGGAWQAIFAAKGIAVSTTTKIGIKFNNAYDTSTSKYTSSMCPYGPRAATINAVTAGLVQMLGGTYPIENITIFDKLVYADENTKLAMQGFPSSSVTPYLVSGAGKPTIMMADPSNLGTNPVQFNAGSTAKNVAEKIMPVVVQQNALIDIAIPKVNVGAGVTAALKNFYGCVDQCVLTHGSTAAEIAAAPTTTLCIPSVYQNIDSRAKVAVCILDAIAGNYDGQAFAGPAFFKNTIAMSADPVTLDYYAVQIINAARVANKLSNIDTPPTSADYLTIQPGSQFPGTVNADGFLNAHYLAWAASSSFNLGNMNNDDLLYADLTGVAPRDGLSPLDGVQGRPMSLRRSASGWTLNLEFDTSGRTHRVESRILDLSGRELRGFGSYSTRQPLASIAWDGRNDRGVTAPAGVYTWETRIDGRVYTQAVQQPR